MASNIFDEAIGMTEDVFVGVWIAGSRRSPWDYDNFMFKKINPIRMTIYAALAGLVLLYW